MRRLRLFLQSKRLLLGFRMGLLAVLLGWATGPACRSLFDGNDRDAEVLNRANYRRLNLDCSHLNLASAALDVPTARQMLRCFNANGALEPLQNLVARLSDEQLQPLIDLGNRHLFTNARNLFGIEVAYETLVKQGALDRILFQASRLLENDEFVASGIALLRQAGAPRDASAMTSLSRRRVSLDPMVLKALERAALKLNPASIENGLDGLLMVLSSNAGGELLKKLKGSSLSGRDLEKDFMAPILRLLTDRDPDHVAVGNELLRLVVDGRLFRWVDDERVFGMDSSSIRTQVPAVASLLRFLSRPEKAGNRILREAEIFDDITSLFQFSNRPIRCLNESKSIDNTAKVFVQEITRREGAEIRDLLLRQNPLNLSFMNAFCEFPAEIGTLYPVMTRLANSSVLEPTARLLKASETQGLTDFLISLLSYTGSGRGNTSRNAGGMKLLLAAFSELHDRGAWDDLLYAVTLPTDRQRAELIQALQFALEPVEALQGRSLYDVLHDDVLAKVSLADLLRFARSLSVYIESDSPLAEPALMALRDAFYSTDSHPLLDVARSVVSEASQNQPLFETLLEVASAAEYRDDFGASVRMVAAMGKDGRLKELLGAILSLFHRFSQSGSYPVMERVAPAFQPERRHNWSSARVALLEERVVPAEVLLGIPSGIEACSRLDIKLAFDEYSAPGWDGQISDFLSCLNAQGSFSAAVRAVEFLRSQPALTSRNFLTYQVDLVRALGRALTREEILEVIDRWIDSANDSRFDRLLEGFHQLTNVRVVGSKESALSAGGTVVEPLLRSVGDLMRHPSQRVRRLLDFGAKVIDDSSVPQLLRYAEQVVDRSDACDHGAFLSGGRCPEPVASAVEENFDRERIRRWVRNRECELDPRKQQQRVAQVVAETQQGVDSWSSNPLTLEPRLNWDAQAFRSYLDPVLDWVAVTDPEPKRDGTRQKSLIEGMTNILRFFSLPARPGVPVGPAPVHANKVAHYQPEYLAQWLRERSTDYTLISYFYPEDSVPRVRLVNSLERLELVLVNADIQFLLPEHFGFKFLAMIGESWGDDRSEIWPDEVRRKYPDPAACDRPRPERDRLKLVRSGKCPRKLEDTVRNDDAFPAVAPMKSILSTLRMFEFAVGYPDLPGCRPEVNPNDPQSVRDAEAGVRMPGSGGAPDFIIPDAIRKSIYNMRQVVNVVENNLPGANSPQAGGLRVLRDLFYETHTSSPENCLSATALSCNRLRVVVNLVRLGMGRVAGQLIQKFPAQLSDTSRLLPVEQREVGTLLDFFRGLIGLAIQPEVPAAVREIFRTPDGKALLWQVLGQIHEVMDSANPFFLPASRRQELDHLSAGERRERLQSWVLEKARMKQLGFHAIGELYRLNVSGELVRGALPTLRTHLGYLKAKAELLQDVLRSRDLSHWVRAAHEDFFDPEAEEEAREAHASVARILTDALRTRDARSTLLEDAIWSVRALSPAAGPGAGLSAFELFVNRAKTLTEDAQFKALRFEESLTDLVHFFQERSSGTQAPQKIRRFLADRMRSRGNGSGPSDLEDLLLLVQREPTNVNGLVQALGYHARTGGEVTDFIELVLRSLGVNRRSPPSRR